MANSTDMLSARPNNRIPIAWLIEQLLADDVLSRESAQLSKRLLTNDLIKTHGAVGALASKRWQHASNKKQVLDDIFLTNWLAKILNQDSVIINPVMLNTDLITSSLSQQNAKHFIAIVLSADTNQIVVATAEPLDTNLNMELAESHPNKKIVKRIASSEEILRIIKQSYDFKDSLSVAATLTAGASNEIQNLEQLLKLSDGTLKDEDQAIVSLVEWLLAHAITLKASDIHLEPHRSSCTIRFRIDGILNKIHELPSAISSPIISRLKVLCRMDVAEKRKPQDGRIKTRAADNREVEFRVSTMPVAFGEKMVLRIFDPEVLTLGLSNMGMAKREYSLWRQLIDNENGIVLVTGPTGSGKTTMLYTTLKELATSEVNVCTIEDPIELINDSFNQMQVHTKIDLGFASGIRTLLRQDPDIIMVGEIRDSETATVAAQASLTGHLVLSTLHTNDSLTAITRLRDLKLPSYLIANTLRGVLAMRLVRLLCPHCKAPDSDCTEAQWQAFTKPYRIPMPKVIYRPGGCRQCRNIGYRGRAALFELLTINQSFRNLIYQDTTIDAYHQEALTQEMVPLRIAGATKVASGITTIQEITTSTPDLYQFN